MRIILHQKYKEIKSNRVYTLISIKGKDFILKSTTLFGLLSVKEKEFVTKFQEAFSLKSKAEVAKNGYKYIKVDFLQIFQSLNGAAVCDSCGELTLKDFDKKEARLIPVLNSIYCNKCFTKWECTAKHYNEDIQYENKKTDYYLKILNGEKNVYV